jgi:hypothetical protein
MFHVAPLMPSHSNDKQQVLRKKHIGNGKENKKKEVIDSCINNNLVIDIVCIIFLEGDQLFNPKAIRSQFLHVYIIVRPEVDSHRDKRHWR